MNRFDGVRFRGTFRDYQQRVLDHTTEYLKDGKINIVAAPGSGKTILGLELIRRLGEPCLILSPTTAIRQQWGERFRDLFLDTPSEFDTLFSFDLHRVCLLNSITYQALYTAVEKTSPVDDEDTDCSDIDLMALMRASGIKTICLDEAHHLKNEWQRALEKFITALDGDIKIISLTATPPYDAEGSEWRRYVNICGEIDEEIFVPELVGQKTLCPHQDYIYFNYPVSSETAMFRTHKERAARAVEELRSLDLFAQVCQWLNEQTDYDLLFSSAKQYMALMTLLHHYALPLDKKLVKEMTANKGLPRFNISYAEIALQFLLDGELLTKEQKAAVTNILKQHMVYDKRRVTLTLTEKMKRTLISSVGKLDSIQKIAASEAGAMGDRLRMLVLTDYIQKENLAKIGTDEPFSSVNVVSIFEVLRRTNWRVPIGVLSGSLVILPADVDLADIKHKKTAIPGTAYCVVECSGSIHRLVRCVGRLFEQGDIRILVGTKSLLGEGWDSPCINTLVLASFVGSYVLSNQMRGRAIRVDKNDPDKSANIWHLVTVEPEYIFEDKALERVSAYLHQPETELVSYDYEVLKRRFDSFMGPHYTTGVVESGIERVTAVHPPYDSAGIATINAEMLALSRQRGEVARQWEGEVADGRFVTQVESEVPAEKSVPIFTFWNVAFTCITTAVEVFVVATLRKALAAGNAYLSVGMLLVMAVGLIVLGRGAVKWLSHRDPARSVRTLGAAVYKTLCACGLIASSAKVETVADRQNSCVSLYLRNASVHDQNVFNTAMAELLSPIENPRYILIAKMTKNRYRYRLSFACPTVIGKKKEYVQILSKELRNTTGRFEPVYAHGEGGRRLILKCRKASYITLNNKVINKRYTVSHGE